MLSVCGFCLDLTKRVSCFGGLSTAEFTRFLPWPVTYFLPLSLPGFAFRWPLFPSPLLYLCGNVLHLFLWLCRNLAPRFILGIQVPGLQLSVSPAPTPQHHSCSVWLQCESEEDKDDRICLFSSQCLGSLHTEHYKGFRGQFRNHCLMWFLEPNMGFMIC